MQRVALRFESARQGYPGYAGYAGCSQCGQPVCGFEPIETGHVRNFDTVTVRPVIR